MAFIIRRGAVYYLNLRLPKHLHHQRNTLRISLDIRDRRNALFLASGIAQRVHLHLAAYPLRPIEELRQLCIQWRNQVQQSAATPDQSFRMTLPMQTSAQLLRPTTAPTATTQSLSTLSELYIKEGNSSGAWREANTLDVQRALSELLERL